MKFLASALFLRDINSKRRTLVPCASLFNHQENLTEILANDKHVRLKFDYGTFREERTDCFVDLGFSFTNEIELTIQHMNGMDYIDGHQFRLILT